jgi:hypothetical protein
MVQGAALVLLDIMVIMVVVIRRGRWLGLRLL